MGDAAGAIAAGTLLAAALGLVSAQAFAAETIEVQGNRRIDAETVRSYFHAAADGRFDEAARDAALKALVATGLFDNVTIERAGDRLVVHLARGAGARPRRVRRQQEDQGQGARCGHRVQAARHAAARDGASRRRPHHGSLPACRARRCRRGAQDHRSRQRPRRPRLRGDGGAKDHGAADQFRRQHGVRQATARRRDQDLRHQHAELPDRRRRVRSRPHRRRSRAVAAVLSQQGLCRRQRDLGESRIRSGAARLYADVRDRRRAALSFRRHQPRQQRAGGR